MTLMEFCGCGLTAYGPAFAMFVLTISHDPIRIIVLVASAFFWLVALLTASLFWNFVTFRSVMPLCIIFSVLVQELFRYFIYVLMAKAEQGLRGLRVPNTNTDLLKNKHIVPYVSGLGYGMMSGGFSLINILAELVGPGTMGMYGDSPDFCRYTSILTMMFTLLHTFWSVIFFSGCDSCDKRLIGWVIFSHLLVSCLSLLNKSHLYWIALSATSIVLVTSAGLAFRIVKTDRSNSN